MTGKKKQETIPELVTRKLPSDEEIRDLAEVYKVFGDPTRAKILSCLSVHDLNVGEIAEIMQLSVSAVSHQLRVLKNAKLVKGIRDGKEIRYSLDDNHVVLILQCGLSHVNEKD